MDIHRPSCATRALTMSFTSASPTPWMHELEGTFLSPVFPYMITWRHHLINPHTTATPSKKRPTPEPGTVATYWVERRQSNLVWCAWLNIHKMFPWLNKHQNSLVTPVTSSRKSQNSTAGSYLGKSQHSNGPSSACPCVACGEAKQQLSNSKQSSNCTNLWIWKTLLEPLQHLLFQFEITLCRMLSSRSMETLLSRVDTTRRSWFPLKAESWNDISHNTQNRVTKRRRLPSSPARWRRRRTEKS
jgi:hypothetical protein